ncbi:aubergine [Fistulifera solaris]|uniref:Aubergine n=1 Tax=Fistulifera solaris TaxID=1519565 RepID=A0A1Z5JWK6_FISSO|nr:aubergine [Fistulifera solaris]|eukprot:GAX18425.1 aubergine [Fistulifera solaris]
MHRGGRGGRENRGGRGGQGRGRGGDSHRGGEARGRGGEARGGGRDFRGGGREGRGRGPDFSRLTSCRTNILSAQVSPNFSVWMFSLECRDKNNKLIDARTRRYQLFQTGFWDQFMARQQLLPQQIEDLKRVVFFQNSTFMSGRDIPGLSSPDQLPLTLCDGSTTNGDVMRIVRMQKLSAPQELLVAWNPAEEHVVLADLRCADCTQGFRDEQSLLQHCRQKGHQPVYFDETSVTKPASAAEFEMFANVALEGALRERMARWGREFIDPQSFTEPKDRNGQSLGVKIFKAYRCNFNLMRQSNTKSALARLTLTIDLRAKVIRTATLLDALYKGNYSPSKGNLSKADMDNAKRTWVGETVITTYDKKCYPVVDLLFDHSPDSLMIPGTNTSHTHYFATRKKMKLKYPSAKPMVVVQGRNKSNIFLPAELVTGNELDPEVKEKLPMIAGFNPDERTKAIDVVRDYLIPGAQTTRGASGLLPALGIALQSPINATCKVMPVPSIIAAGVSVPKEKADNWAPVLSKAKFNVNTSQATTLNVVLVCSAFLIERGGGYKDTYDRIRDLVNGHNAKFRLGNKPHEVVKVDMNKSHHGAVQKHFSGKVPANVFILDFTKPRGSMDPDYPVVKMILAQNGYISQFLNFNTYRHDEPRDMKRSNIILQGVARQILEKVGVRIWWVAIPKELPLPSVLVGVDVFHAPRVFNPITKEKVGKASVAAIVVQIVRKENDILTYTKTFVRKAGQEYQLNECLEQTVKAALKLLHEKPKSCVIWRDGIGEGALATDAIDEIKGIRKGLGADAVVGTKKIEDSVPLAYIVCQKRIATKFFAMEGQQPFGAPSGTLVEGFQGLRHHTFYINGRAPPFSTPKPVRFITVHRDAGLARVDIPSLTWSSCHNYANWAGPVKLPAPTQYAHKLAELAGNMPDHGGSISAEKYANTLYFL